MPKEEVGPRKLRRERREEDNERVVTRHFDQGPDGGLIPAERLEDELQAKIEALEAEVAKLKVGTPDTSTGSVDNGLFDSDMEKSTQGLLARLSLSTLGKATYARDPQTIALQNIFIPPEHFPAERRQYILRFNSLIEKAATGHSASVSKDLWKFYSLCRKTLSSAWTLIPHSVWSVLWATFSRESLYNPDRMAHIHRLGEDMEAAGAVLDTSQQLLYLEAIFLEGSHDVAIKRWESARVALSFDAVSETQYWSLGVRMLAHDNNPSMAQAAADVLLNATQGEKDARVLIPIMAAWLASKDPAAVKKAWALYIRLRIHVGSSMSMEDYDACVGVFMTCQRPDIALAVFRDMMLSQELDAFKAADSVAVYKRVLKIKGDLRTLELEPAEKDWTSWEPFTFLPKKNQNKFFYGSWLKKLLGDGETDWAARVVDLMYQRGVAPDSRHLNGIIGAWLRTGIAKSIQKAETTAWKMIDNRVEFVKRRARTRESLASANARGSVRPVSTIGKGDHRCIKDTRWLASATIETFSILAESYRRRQKEERIKELCDVIRICAISPNTTFMNSLLKLGITGHRKAWSWALYLQLVREDGVRPDHETFACLWKIMKTHVDPVKNRTTAGYPSCRALFSEMMQWSSNLGHENMPRKLYDRIVLCFGLADDQVGTGIALRAMQIFYAAYPDQATIRSIVLQLTKAGIVNAAGFAPRRLNLNSSQKERMKQITRLLQSFKDQRDEALLTEGKAYEDLDEKAKGEESIILLCEVLRFVVQSRTSPDQINAPGALPGGDMVSFQQLAEVAAKQMGIPQDVRLPWNPNRSIGT
ncbi:MAG: hypothetical protein M1818_001531 [Claussenomyces sp. TS43310]|nr:MAG: hypothetical protein M1818_001531 [Claussenomyces sp. TS43310]